MIVYFISINVTYGTSVIMGPLFSGPQAAACPSLMASLPLLSTVRINVKLSMYHQRWNRRRIQLHSHFYVSTSQSALICPKATSSMNFKA